MARSTRKLHRGGDANNSKSKTKYNLGKNVNRETQDIVNKFLVSRTRRRSWMNWVRGHPRDAHDRDLRKEIDKLLRQYDEKTGDLKKLVKRIVEVKKRLERNKEEREMLEKVMGESKNHIKELERQMDDIRREIDNVGKGLNANPFKNPAPAPAPKNPFAYANGTKKIKASKPTTTMVVRSSKPKKPNSRTAASLAAAQKQEEEYQAEQKRIEEEAQAARNAAKAAANAANAAVASRGINAAVGNIGSALPTSPAGQEEPLLLENAKGNAFNQAGLPRAENDPPPEMGQAPARDEAEAETNNERQRKINTSLFD